MSEKYNAALGAFEKIKNIDGPLDIGIGTGSTTDIFTENFLTNENFKKPFDITLLGMGQDGHFASLFPDMINHNEAFDLNESPKILITPPQGNPYLPRITMNLSLIMKSINIVLLIKGKAKQDIFNKAKKDEDLPIHYLIKNRNKNFFVEKINE